MRHLVLVCCLATLAAACSTTPPAATCGVTNPCASGLTCSAGSCVDLSCPATPCPTGKECVAGACYLTSCTFGPCPTGKVCLSDACAFPACVGVQCPGDQTCVRGACTVKDCATTTCGTNEVCDQGACVIDVCLGVLCPSGGVCQAGQCVAPSCSDGARNGDETDVDCGGACAGCALGKHCVAQGDCNSRVCTASACVAPSCTDGAKNGDETDVDCGGSCPGCANGRACVAPADCSSRACTQGSCAATSCADAAKNGAETDVDCGGGACPACPSGKACQADGDCFNGACVGLVCQGALCTDGAFNGKETDIDCGGGSCPACAANKACLVGADCQSNNCNTGTHRCVAETCSDLVRNGTETDVDCGGPACVTCAAGRTCLASTDCTSKVCVTGTCKAPSCTDGVKNGTETDLDCGGSCGACVPGKMCVTVADCTTAVCTAGLCRNPSCTDSLRNGNETDVDCGGVDCPPCGLNKICAAPTDCNWGVCSTALRCDSTVRDPGGTMPDSKTTYCVDAMGSQAMSCPGAGTPGDGQDGSFQLSVPVYTSTADTVTDSVTGLTWQRFGNPAMDWDTAMHFCANLTLAGASDWRLPSRMELVTLLDFGAPSSSTLVDPAFQQVANSPYWTSSTSTAATTAWTVTLINGQVASSLQVTNPEAVKCVRGTWTPASGTPTPPPAARYTISAGTVLDNRTRLTWERAPDPTQRIWVDALAYCRNLNLAGTGWRLPTIKELMTLVEETKGAPTIDPVAFPGTYYSAPINDGYVSSTMAVNSANVWQVPFSTGNIVYYYIQQPMRVRCVR